MNYYAYPWGRWIKWGVAAFLALVLLISGISNYNSLAGKKQNVQSNWSQVENQMQTRSDKIVNLVEVVKGYVKHEEKVFGDIAAARSAIYSTSGDVNSKLDADTKLTNATRSMLVLVENYPDLKASQQFHDLQIAIEGSENRVAVARRDFIQSVQTYNTGVTRFPTNIFAKLMGFGEMKYFEASSDAKESPKIQF